LVSVADTMTIFDRLQTLDDLCTALACSPETLRSAVVEMTSYCDPLSRRKKKGGTRKVYLVKDPVRRLQRLVALWLKQVHVDPCVTGFLVGSSAFANAKVHAARPFVLTADIDNFFDTITSEMVRDVFRELGAGSVVAITLARLCTLDHKLIQGGRASPMISNLASRKLDQIIVSNIGADNIYTRYVDDIAISGHTVPSVPELISWVHQAGFELNARALITKQRAGPFVTGFNVADETPRLSRKTRRRIERFLHIAEKYDVDAAAKISFTETRLKNHGKSAMGYVIGLATWLREIDPILSADWSSRITALENQ
jgi:RNA-directed DNA polymerase